MATKPKTKRKSKTFAEQVEAYHKILEEQGAGYYLAKRRITPCTLAKEIEEHLKATEVKVFHHDGEIIYSEPLRAWSTQFRALELAVKLYGMMPKEKIELDATDGLIERIMEARKRANGGG